MIFVDFNDLDDDEGGISVLASHSPTVLVPGQSALLTDGSYVCMALVESALEDLAQLRIDWSTWRRASVTTWHKPLPTNGATAGKPAIAKVFTKSGMASRTTNSGPKTKVPA